MKASDLIEALKLCFRTKRAVMLWGPPGVGKSAIIAHLKELMGEDWQLLDFRLVQRDTVDMRGVPFVDADGRTKWAVPAEFPKEGTKGIWFLDEANAAHPQVQVVAYQLTHDRAVGEYKVPEGWVIVLAGNREADGAVVHKMSSALASRVVHLDLDVDNDDWHDWAIAHDVHPMIRAFLKFKPTLLHDFDKKARAFPCPRTWEICSDIVKQNPAPAIEHALFAGVVGDGAAIELSGFVRTWRGLPDIDHIIENPRGARVPGDSEVSAMFAVALALSSRVTAKTFKNIVIYLERLPVEYNIMAVIDAVKRDQGLVYADGGVTLRDWIHRHKDVTLPGMQAVA